MTSTVNNEKRPYLAYIDAKEFWQAQKDGDVPQWTYSTKGLKNKGRRQELLLNAAFSMDNMYVIPVSKVPTQEELETNIVYNYSATSYTGLGEQIDTELLTVEQADTLDDLMKYVKTYIDKQNGSITITFDIRNHRRNEMLKVIYNEDTWRLLANRIYTKIQNDYLGYMNKFNTYFMWIELIDHINSYKQQAVNSLSQLNTTLNTLIGQKIDDVSDTFIYRSPESMLKLFDSNPDIRRRLAVKVATENVGRFSSVTEEDMFDNIYVPVFGISESFLQSLADKYVGYTPKKVRDVYLGIGNYDHDIRKNIVDTIRSKVVENPNYRKIIFDYQFSGIDLDAVERQISKDKEILYNQYQNYNTLVLGHHYHQFGSDIQETVTSLDLDYMAFKMFPRGAFRMPAGYLYEDFQKKTKQKVNQDILIGNRSLGITDPTCIYRSDKLHYVNCFSACISALNGNIESEKLEKMTSRLEKQWTTGIKKRTYDIIVDNDLLDEAAHILEAEIEIYEIDYANPELNLLGSSACGYSKKVFLGSMKTNNGNHIIILPKDPKDLDTNYGNDYKVAFYDLESVQCHVTGLQIAFMAGYRLGSISRKVYQLIWKYNDQFSDELYDSLEDEDIHVSRPMFKKEGSMIKCIIKHEKDHIFVGKNCIRDLMNQIVSDSEQSNKVIRVFGFNSCGYDNIFIANHVSAIDKWNPQLNILKKKLYVKTKHAEFRDIMPLIPPGPLKAHCENFRLFLKKKDGDVGFDFLNEIFNNRCDNDIDKFVDYLNNNPSEHGCSLMESITTYNKYDLYSTEELTVSVRSSMEILYGQAMPGLKVNYLTFDTLGQAAKALYCRLNDITPVPGSLNKAKKTKEYKYQGLLNGMTMRKYQSLLRPSIIASISYSKTGFDSKTIEDLIIASADIVSLYPTIMNSVNVIFGYGRLTFQEKIWTEADLKDPSKWTPGIYEVYLECLPNKRPGFQGPCLRRIPYKNLGCGTPVLVDCNTVEYPEEGLIENKEIYSYNWIHDQDIHRPLPLWDIIHAVNSGDFKVRAVTAFATWEKTITGKEMNGSYIEPFATEKNRQDKLKEENSPEYSAGLREMSKASMNVMSGKLVQTPDYETSIKVYTDSELDKLYDTVEESATKLKISKKESTGIDTNIYAGIIGKFRTCITENETSWLKMTKLSDAEALEHMFYDYSLVGSQIYCYSREYMFKHLIDPCYAAGYEPYVIETDSLKTDQRFFEEHRKSGPEINITGSQDPLYTTKGVLKKFGQAELEMVNITRLMTYTKKSYYMEIVGYDKPYFRFKGVTTNGTILPTASDLEILNDYIELENMKPEKRSKYICNENFIKLRKGVMNYYYNMLSDKSKLLSKGPVQKRMFEDLLSGREVAVLRPQLKKNLTLGKDDNMMNVSGYIATKIFNKQNERISIIKQWSSKRLERLLKFVSDQGLQINLPEF